MERGVRRELRMRELREEGWGKESGRESGKESGRKREKE